MMKFKKKVKSSNRLKLKKSQRIYMTMGICISLLSSLALFLNAQNANQRQQVWITSKAIAAGEIIDEKNVKLIQVDLGEVSSNYLDETIELFGQSSLQPLSLGTLLKPEHIGFKSNLRNVALRISNGHLPPSLKMNDFIDVWFSDPITLTSTLIIPKISVVWIDEVDSNFGGVTTVVVAVPEANVPQLVNSARADGLDLVHREN
jgi:SAF domain